MSIKKYFLVAGLLISSFSSFTQDTCGSMHGSLLQFIHNNISVNREDYTNDQSEYFILDIKLKDSDGSIAKIDYLRKNTSQHYPHMDSLISRFSTSWKRIPCSYKRVLIPVYLLFQNDGRIGDYPEEMTIKPSNKNKNVLFLNVVVVNIFSPVN